jgi:hypothetical protein
MVAVRVRAALALVLLAATGAGCTPQPAPVVAPSRCETLHQKYGLSPCPPDPIPVESVPVRNLDPKLTDADARRIAQAYLSSRALYYLAIQDNSETFFSAGVIDLPEVSPLMFDAETNHVKEARAQHGTLVLTARSTLMDISVVPLPDDLRDGLEVTPKPMADAIVVRASGPEEQVIRVPGKPDRPVATLAAGDGYTLLVGGVLVTRDGLPQTFAELGQWECLDPDTHGACQLPPAGGSG